MVSALPAIQVAISTDLLLAFSQIPRQQQNKVRTFIEKFQANPTAPGINYEVIQQARDPNLRSVRIDQNYRGIVLKPKQGNVYALLWIANHDDAYEWARKRQVAIHPATGALQVLLVNETIETGVSDIAPVSKATESRQPLLTGCSDADLVRLGVPDAEMSFVRGLSSERALDEAQRSLPAEAYEALVALAAGFTIEEILAERVEDNTAPHDVDVEDFAAALAHPDTKRRFVVLTDDEELARILEAPLAQWRVFLHPSQRRLVEQHAKGPVRVLGGAGTGKTVVAMHRAKHLATNMFRASTDRILVTTFTKNLAADLEGQLRSICSTDAMSRIEVSNLDAWVADFFKRQGVAWKPVYGDQGRQSWEAAIALADSRWSPAFLREEFERVILDQGLTTEEDYVFASRVGRGTQVGRKDRKALWAVFEDYRARLKERGLIEPADAMREARLLLANKGPVLPYRAVVVDEAQDLGPQAFQLIRAIVPPGPNDLFIVGDAHQRIYGRKVVLSKCGIEVRGRRSSRLKINYRTTDEIRRWAVALLEGKAIDDLDGELDTSKGYKSLLHGEPPHIELLPNFAAEVAYLVKRLRQWQGEGTALKDVCVVARTTALRDQYAVALQRSDVPVYVVQSQGDDQGEDGVRVATMHRVKGLEFDRVVVAGVNAGVVPQEFVVDSAADATSAAEHELAERSLLYVAVTRAKREALLTSSGNPGCFLAFVNS